MRGAENAVTIVVKEDDWGGGAPTDIKTLLHNVAWHVTTHLRGDVNAMIEVGKGTGDPMIQFRAQGQTTYTVLLNATGTDWVRYSYQFAHEFCHLVSRYERLRGSTNNWFHESICEMASLFTLRSMGMTSSLGKRFELRGRGPIFIGREHAAGGS